MFTLVTLGVAQGFYISGRCPEGSDYSENLLSLASRVNAQGLYITTLQPDHYPQGYAKGLYITTLQPDHYPQGNAKGFCIAGLQPNHYSEGNSQIFCFTGFQPNSALRATP